MFNATIASDTLIPSIKAMSALVDECRVEIAPNGMSARSADPANAAMCSIDIPSEQFTTFDATEAELGIDLTRFVEILGMSEKGGDVTLTLDEDTHKLDIVMNGLSYTLALLDTTTLRKAPQIPELDLPAEIGLSGTVFKRMVKAASMTGDHMQIGVEGDTFFMSATGDSDKVRLDLSVDELISLKAADVSSLFSLDYMVDIGKGIGNPSNITIHLGRDLPVVIDFDPSEDCHVVYVLAPRIENDD